MTEMSKKTSFIITLLCYLVAFLFFTGVNPSSLPVGLLLVPFAVIFSTVFMTLHSIALLFTERISFVQRMTIIALVSTATLLLLIQTVAQLTIRDIILSSSIVLILVWYLNKTSKKPEV